MLPVRKKPINITIGKRLQAARIAAGMSQAALAEAVSMEPQTISAIETGAAGTSFESLCKMCRILKITTDQVLMGPDYDIEVSNGLQKAVASIPKSQEDIVEQIIRLHLKGVAMAQKTQRNKNEPEQ